MDVVTYKQARKHLNTLMDRAIRDVDEILITRESGDAVVMIPLESWSSIQECLHLLSTPGNAARLRSALAQFPTKD